MANNDYLTEAIKGKPHSLTSIAFHTGATLERQRIAKAINQMANTWQKPTALNYRQMLEALAEQIATGELK